MMIPLLFALAGLVAAPQPTCITIVGTNDIHGAIESKTIVAGDGAGSVTVGGVTALSGYIKILRQQSSGLLLIDAGDIYQGSLPSNLSEGRAMIEAMGLMGYDASAIGNHEFDFGAVGGPKAKISATGPARLGVVKARIAEARFPFLVTNMLDRQSGTAITWENTRPSLLKTVGGVRVGIIGAMTPTTPQATRLSDVATLSFLPAAPGIIAEAAKLRAQGAQLVVLAAHMGGSCRNIADANDIASCANTGIDGELLAVLAELPKGTVDVAIGGHTHNFIAHWYGDTAVLESGTRATHMGQVVACVRPGASGIDRQASTIKRPQPLCLTTWKDGTCSQRAKGTKTSVATFMGRKVRPDPAVQKAMTPYLAAVNREQMRPTGAKLLQPLTAPQIAQLTAEAMRRETHSDFGLQNRGGVRDGLPAGTLNVGQVFEVLPFDNMVTQLSLRGEQIERLAATMVRQLTPRLWPLWANIKVEVKDDATVVVTDGKGAKLVAQQVYTLATNDFLATGGDVNAKELDELPAQDKVTTEVTMRAALIPLLAELYPAPL